MIALKGRQGKTIVVDGGIVKIIKKAWLLAAIREKTIPIRNISSVEVKKPGVMAGFIQFSIAGGAVRDSSFKLTGGAIDAAKDENSVLFVGEPEYRAALEIKAHIESYREPAVNAPASSFSVADEILKLKSLRDNGIITDAQFETKKHELLGGQR